MDKRLILTKEEEEQVLMSSLPKLQQIKDANLGENYLASVHGGKTSNNFLSDVSQ